MIAARMGGSQVALDWESTATMSTTNSKSWTRFVPYCGALVGLLVGYGGAMLITSQQMLAVGVATIAALGGYLALRVIQMRGKLTLGLTAFGLPLLAALACFLFLRLTPYIDRQRAIDQMRESGIAFTARSPDQSGEWLRDRSGNMLPIWLARWIGPECMAEIRTITADLAQLKRADLSKLQNSKIVKVVLRRDGESPPLSRNLVAWLNDCPELRSIDLALAHYAEADAAALGQLLKDCRVQVGIDADTATGDFGCLPDGSMVRLSGGRLTAGTSEQIGQLQKPSLLTLEFLTVAPGGLGPLEQLDRDVPVYVMGATLTHQDLVDLAMQGRARLALTGVVLPKELGFEQDATSKIRTETLWIQQMQVSPVQLQHLCQLFNCRWVSLQQVMSESELESLWATTALEELRCFDGSKWHVMSRPDE